LQDDFQWKYKKNDGSKKDLIYKSLAMIANYAILEKQHNGTMNGKSNISGVFVTKENKWNFWSSSKERIAGK
jgi:hypothetical protein